MLSFSGLFSKKRWQSNKTMAFAHCATGKARKRYLSSRSLRLEPLESRQLLTVGATMTTTTINTGYMGPVDVSGVVWNDSNHNGVRDAGEPGVAGAVVELHRQDDNSVHLLGTPSGSGYGRVDRLISTAVTDADGQYSFSSLNSISDYYEKFRAPLDYSFMPKGGDNSSDVAGVTDTFSASAGTQHLVCNAGLLGTPSPSGWSLAIGTMNSSTHGKQMLTDASGNVYVTGTSSGIIDLDPGPGTYTLDCSGNGQTQYLAKYTPGGALIWGCVVPNCNIALADDGGVYLTGVLTGTRGYSFSTDSLPLSLTPVGTNPTGFVVKLNGAGKGEWDRLFTQNVLGSEVADDGSVYVFGTTVTDGNYYDPNAVTPFIIAAIPSIFVTKLAPSGSLAWSQFVDGVDGQQAANVQISNAEVGPDGGLYVTGSFAGAARFGRGTSAIQLTATGAEDTFLCKLDSAGNFAWADDLGTQDNSAYLLTHFAVGPDGSVCTVGTFSGTVDFDPGAGVFNLTSTTSNDTFISKFDAAGNFQWADSLSGANINSVTVVNDGSVYTTGTFTGQVDFDPGLGTFNLTSNSISYPGTSTAPFYVSDYFLSKVDSAGEFAWAKDIASEGICGGGSPAAIVMADGNVYISSGFERSITKLDADGNSVWKRDVAGLSTGSVVVEADGTVYVAGTCNGSTPMNWAFLTKLLPVASPMPLTITHVWVNRTGPETDGSNQPTSNDQIAIHWELEGDSRQSSSSITIDGQSVGKGSSTQSDWIGPLAAGFHTYDVHLTDAAGNTQDATGTFYVALGSPVISQVVVAEATPKNGRLDANDPIVITWALTDAQPGGPRPIGITIDGLSAGMIYGPYATSTINTTYWAGVCKQISAGTHNYTITVANANGGPVTYSGTFDVAPLATTISSVVMAEAKRQDDVIGQNDQVVISWAITTDRNVVSVLTVDGQEVHTQFGPYAAPDADTHYFSSLFGPLGVGTHTFAITTSILPPAAPPGGVVPCIIVSGPTYTGTFEVMAPVTLEISRATVDTASEIPVITWHVAAPAGIASTAIVLDGKAVSTVYGPYGTEFNADYAGVIGHVTAGPHTYTITTTDMNGLSATYNGDFVTVSTAPTISDVVFAPIGANQVTITWNAADSDGVASCTLTLDGKAVKNIYGPYGSKYDGNYAGVAATHLTPGVHTFVITATDATGTTAMRSVQYPLVLSDAATAAPLTIAPVSSIDHANAVDDVFATIWNGV